MVFIQMKRTHLAFSIELPFTKNSAVIIITHFSLFLNIYQRTWPDIVLVTCLVHAVTCSILNMLSHTTHSLWAPFHVPNLIPMYTFNDHTITPLVLPISMFSQLTHSHIFWQFYEYAVVLDTDSGWQALL